jgi:hypothetical protein
MAQCSNSQQTSGDTSWTPDPSELTRVKLDLETHGYVTCANPQHLPAGMGTTGTPALPAPAATAWQQGGPARVPPAAKIASEW